MSGSISRSSLTQEQWAFLEENFVVYDPKSGETHNDFGRLNDSQVVCMGEIHDTDVLARIQKTFFHLFAQVPSCLFVEYLPPEVSIQKEKIPGWEDLPETLDVLGSDIRKKTWALQNIMRWLSIQQEITRLSLNQKEEFRKCIACCAQLLNEEVSSNRAKVMKVKDKDILQVSKAVQQALQKIYEDGLYKLHASNMQINSSIEELTQIDLPIFSSNLRETNQGILDEIRKISAEYSKIFVNWGLGHFIDEDKSFYRGLEESEISHIVLLPNKQRNVEAQEEDNWRHEEIDQMSLEIQSKTTTSTELLPDGKLQVLKGINTIKLWIPEIFQSLFPSSIQKLFEKKKLVSALAE